MCGFVSRETLPTSTSYLNFSTNSLLLFLGMTKMIRMILQLFFLQQKTVSIHELRVFLLVAYASYALTLHI